ncbi:MAG TPA: hypothetical protein PKJ89_11970, partial [Solirubrobacterales bacterium]|nr:hypothetical protein [Solirubrobacterales bacterium]
MPKKEDRARPAGDGEAGKPARPALTEKQRIEARRARQSRSHRKSPEGNALSRGLRATGFEVRRTASFIGGGVIAALAALGPLFSSAGMGLVWLIERIGEGLKVLGRVTGRAVAALGRAVVAADRVITPHRALLLVAAIAAVLLAVSQFKGLGQIEIGQSGYSGFQDLARAPAIDHTTPAGVHTKILVPIAGLALVAVAVILLGGLASTAGRFSRFRRLASMVLVTIGLLTLAVALLVDLPDARDTTEAALAYSGVKAVLLSGFWLELAAGAALTVTGFALLFEPSPGRAREKRPQEEPGSRPGGRPGSGNPDESRERRRADLLDDPQTLGV